MIRIPTIQELYDDIISSLETQYGTSISPSGKTFIRSMAAVQSATLKLFYLSNGNIQKNIFVDTAEPESIGGTLERFGRVKLGRNPFAATAGQYKVTVIGEAGAIIKAQTTFKSDDSSLSPGYLFILDNEHTMTSSEEEITLRALTPGTESRLETNDTLTATSPIALVNSIVTVTTEEVEPLAAETTEAYRQATINSYQLEPQGGAATDYRLWAQDAQGVVRVYPYAKSNAVAEINLFVEATVADSTDGKGTPSQSILDDVESVIEFDPDTTLPLYERGRRPLGVFQVNYLPVTVKEIDITISDYQGLSTSRQTY
jgi:uncharacterized phage protein gp47/JayE